MPSKPKDEHMPANEFGKLRSLLAEKGVKQADIKAAIGDIDTTVWTSAQRTTWETRCLDVLGVMLPVEVDRGKRLVQIFLGCLLSRQTDHERGYRFS